nr:immunoglobulin heavy chain junction region [Macaca mulatta]MOY22743.1 immunoglobulin heavy chain junction region [Macaca mulatta]MOY23668.1 immunoglobulin heavy chain junction region [Macaca mulatta]MOY23768.1 immunoglobulin heavy chain junction region [Macaca mulatta]MOY24962.1 immunoglobulin heavy chain junction region [Macaca mulatta]
CAREYCIGNTCYEYFHGLDSW